MEYAVLSVVGMLAGVLGGMLGIGGSVVMIPAMVWIFSSLVVRPESVHQYQAAAMIVNFLLAGTAVIRHVQAKAIYVGVWKYMAPAAIIGVALGVIVSRQHIFTGGNQHYMRIVFGAFMIYVAGYNLWKLQRGSSEGVSSQEADSARWTKKAGVGLPIGFAAGLLGIGGGALAVPALQMVLRLPLRNAIATSATMIFSIAWFGAIMKNTLLGGDGTVVRSLILAGILAPTAMIGGYIGGRLTHKLPLKLVRIAFIALMLVAAWKMFTAPSPALFTGIDR